MGKFRDEWEALEWAVGELAKANPVRGGRWDVARDIVAAHRKGLEPVGIQDQRDVEENAKREAMFPTYFREEPDRDVWESRVREIAEKVFGEGMALVDCVSPEVCREIAEEVVEAHKAGFHWKGTRGLRAIAAGEGLILVPLAAWEALGKASDQLWLLWLCEGSGANPFKSMFEDWQKAARACGLPGFEEAKDG